MFPTMKLMSALVVAAAQTQTSAFAGRSTFLSDMPGPVCRLGCICIGALPASVRSPSTLSSGTRKLPINDVPMSQIETSNPKNHAFVDVHQLAVDVDI